MRIMILQSVPLTMSHTNHIIIYFWPSVLSHLSSAIKRAVRLKFSCQIKVKTLCNVQGSSSLTVKNTLKHIRSVNRNSRTCTGSGCSLNKKEDECRPGWWDSHGASWPVFSSPAVQSTCCSDERPRDAWHPYPPYPSTISITSLSSTIKTLLVSLSS